MKYLTGAALFVLAAWGIWYVTHLAITPVDSGAYIDFTVEE